MITLNEETGIFIDNSFTQEQKKIILDSFTTFENFQLTHYEDKYFNIAINSEDNDPETLGILFLQRLRRDLEDLIIRHGIKLDEDNSFRLPELNSICCVLLTIPKLEDLVPIRQIVYSELDNRDKFRSIVTLYSSISDLRMMECISDVTDGLIETIKKLVDNSVEDTEEIVDREHLKVFNSFLDFIERTPCLGVTLQEEGYPVHLNLDELINLMPYKIEFNNSVVQQTALDVLSILMMSKDCYKDPLIKYDEQSSIILSNSDEITRVRSIITEMYADFLNWYNVKEESEDIDKYGTSKKVDMKHV